MKKLTEWWPVLWLPAINLWNAPHMTQSLTLNEVKDRLKMLDEVILLEVLDISAEELIEAFSDRIEERQDYFIKDLELEEWED